MKIDKIDESFMRLTKIFKVINSISCLLVDLGGYWWIDKILCLFFKELG